MAKNQPKASIRNSRGVELWGTVRGEPKRIASIPIGIERSEFQKEAMRWSYIVRQRGRWSQSWDSVQEIAELAKETLETLGVTEEQVSELALGTPFQLQDSEWTHCQLIEVSIPWIDEANGWEARIMPWEHLLSAATRDLRGEVPLVVVRVLKILNRSSSRLPKFHPTRMGTILLTPDRLRNEFDFHHESEWVSSSIGSSLKHEVIEDPSIAELQAWLKSFQPNVVHLRAVDARRAAKILNLGQEEQHDGFAIRGGRGCQLLYPSQAADLLTESADGARFVSLNLTDSAARIAPLTISRGARGVLAFENHFPEALVELFLGRFYDHWVQTNWDTLDAFVHAVATTRPYARRVRGGGLVLWSDHSLLKDRQTRQANLGQGNRLPGPWQGLEATGDIRDRVSIEVEVESEINYALLHNRQSLLRKLLLRFHPGERGEVDFVRDIDVSVRLFIGNESLPYHSRVSLSRKVPTVNLADPLLEPGELHGRGGIYVPLVSEYFRNLEENVQSSVEVEVRWHDQCLHKQSYSVQLAPIDQWRFQERDILWLPSFVHPRDPAVAKVVASAQRYLCCLRDDPYAGFEGYASEMSTKDSRVSPKIMDQVRALWSAILLDHRLHYITPPPSYSASTQRLRSPSQTLEQGRGTCIDLAILFASCLEWIELYPVIFLHDEHAFVGFWRDLETQEAFTEPKLSRDMASDPQQSSLAASGASSVFAWYNARSAYLEIRDLVSRGELIPLESTCLTGGEGLEAAQEVARAYFDSRHPRSFHSMIDIVRARSRVTPLPYS